MIDELLQRPVQGCGPESDLTFCALQYFLHDAVAVLLAAHEGQQDVEPIALEWQESLRILSWHGVYVSHDIYIGQDYLRVIFCPILPLMHFTSLTSFSVTFHFEI